MSCQKEEPLPLVGTTWECIEKDKIIVFKDNYSGIYYSKVTIDDVYDEIFSLYDFTYSISGKEITLNISFSLREAVNHYVLEDSATMTWGVFHYSSEGTATLKMFG